MILQIINLKNKQTKNAYFNRIKDLNELTFVPELGIEVKQTNEESIKIIRNNILNNESIKFLQEKNPNSGLIVFRSINDLIDLYKKTMSTISSGFLTDLNSSIENYINFEKKLYRIGEKQFSYSDTCLMGILNVTPDSFSDGGKYFDKTSAVEHGLQLIEDGADIIDIGGESTRPGAADVSEEEEIKRIIPVIEGILIRKPGALISVDTTKSNVAKICIQSGAVLINDISGLTFDNKIADVASEFNAMLILMHIKGTPRTMQVNPSYINLIDEIYNHLYHQSKKAELNGVKNIVIDPGIGFGKTVEQNYEILNRLNDFKSLGFPIMVGVSRKSFIGKTLNLEITERDVPTVITETFSLMKGASIIRTHNVKYAKQLSTLYKTLS